MSPHMHNEIARVRQQEIATRAINSHRSRTAPTSGERRRTVKHHFVRVAAAIGACVAAGSAVAVSDAHTIQRPVKQRTVHVSAPQLAREIHALEAKGYVPAACTVSGTLARNYKTGQSVLIERQHAARHLAR